VSNGPAAGGGYLLPAGQKVKVRGAAGVASTPGAAAPSLVNHQYRLASNAHKATIWFLKAAG